MLVKKRNYTGFCVYRRSYLLWSLQSHILFVMGFHYSDISRRRQLPDSQALDEQDETPPCRGGLVCQRSSAQQRHTSEYSKYRVYVDDILHPINSLAQCLKDASHRTPLALALALAEVERHDCPSRERVTMCQCRRKTLVLARRRREPRAFLRPVGKVPEPHKKISLGGGGGGGGGLWLLISLRSFYHTRPLILFDWV